MTTLIILFLAIAMVFALFAVFKAKHGSMGPKTNAYCARGSLFTPKERSFLAVLEPAIPPGVRVFGKVRLEDIMDVQTGLKRGAQQAARNRINCMHVDFLLVRASDFAPLAGIELDDLAPESENHQQQDKVVDAMFASAGLPLLHVPVQKVYQPEDVKAAVAAAISTWAR